MVDVEDVPACPKHMVFGPCEGVAVDGLCEVGDRRCPFAGGLGSVELGARAVRPARSSAAREMLAVLDRRPLVVVELPVAGPTIEAHRRAAATVAGEVDAVLLGDSPWARVQLPPSLRAAITMQEGLRVVAGLHCRDRNRVALEGEILALDELEVAMTLCLTGDHPALGLRPDAAAVFDLESTTLAMAASSSRMLVAVAESPAVMPVEARPLRLARKVQAGAEVCFINHSDRIEQVESFAGRVQGLAVPVRLIASVPLSVSAAGRRRLAHFFPGAVSVSPAAPLGATDRSRSIRAAVEHATRLLAVPGIDGVDISAVPGDGEEVMTASALAEVARELGGGSGVR